MVAVYACYLIAYIIRRMGKKFNKIYYSDDGYWRGKSAIQKLAKALGSTKEEAEKWLLKQPLYQGVTENGFQDWRMWLVP